jgi:hypothetical protein
VSQVAHQLAHGLVGREDLPVPFGLALTGATVAVAGSFAAAGLLRRGDEGGRDRSGWVLPAGLARLADATWLRVLLRSLTGAAFALVLASALFGPDADAALAPFALYALFWPGLVVVSLLLGPVWRLANPLRGLHAGLSALTGGDPEVGLRELPERWGYRPAALTLLAFSWLELVPEWRTRPLPVGVFLLLYAVGQLVAAQVYGARWFDRGDAFDVVSTLLGRLSVLGRRADRRLVLRSPVGALRATAAEPGLVAVVVVLLGATGFDGLTRTELYQDLAEPDSIPAGTQGLLAMVGLVWATYLLATRAAARGGVRAGVLPGAFAASMLPIAAGYALAHYVSLLLVESQVAVVLFSDPFSNGSDWFGTARWLVDYERVPRATIAVLQVAAIVVGHVVGVVAAHDRARQLLPARDVVRAQLPLAGLMVAYTLGGIALLLGA